MYGGPSVRLGLRKAARGAAKEPSDQTGAGADNRRDENLERSPGHVNVVGVHPQTSNQRRGVAEALYDEAMVESMDGRLTVRHTSNLPCENLFRTIPLFEQFCRKLDRRRESFAPTPTLSLTCEAPCL